MFVNLFVHVKIASYLRTLNCIQLQLRCTCAWVHKTVFPGSGIRILSWSGCRSGSEGANGSTASHLHCKFMGNFHNSRLKEACIWSYLKLTAGSIASNLWVLQVGRFDDYVRISLEQPGAKICRDISSTYFCVQLRPLRFKNCSTTVDFLRSLPKAEARRFSKNAWSVSKCELGWTHPAAARAYADATCTQGAATNLVENHGSNRPRRYTWFFWLCHVVQYVSSMFLLKNNKKTWSCHFMLHTQMVKSSAPRLRRPSHWFVMWQMEPPGKHLCWLRFVSEMIWKHMKNKNMFFHEVYRFSDSQFFFGIPQNVV